MPAEVKKEIQLEIAHVLFTDIVGYSKLPISMRRIEHAWVHLNAHDTHTRLRVRINLNLATTTNRAATPDK